MVRDDSWKAGKLRVEVEEPQDYYSRYWREDARRREAAERMRGRRLPKKPTPPWRLPNGMV
jgi:hypothetical protein